jgi:phosphoribosyl-ATP pyrophosphohydrolase
MADHITQTLFKILKERKNFNTDKSYTALLLNNPNLLAKKIGEESTELIIDLVSNNKTGVINESADLLYHLIVSWVYSGVHPEEIWDELSKRTSKSGIEEKKNRKN